MGSKDHVRLSLDGEFITVVNGHLYYDSYEHGCMPWESIYGEGMDIVTQTDLETVRVLKALADETRFEIVRMLCRQPMCGGDLLERFSITQPTLSYHIKLLTDSGLVVGAKEGAFIRYSLNRACFAQVRAHFCGFCEPEEAGGAHRESDEPTD